jgi:hypothetical protein
VELNNNAEGGTNGVTVSAANSGGASGNAWDSVAGTPTITYDNAQALGTLAYKVVASTTAQQVVWAASHGTQSETWGRLYLWSNANPTGVTGIVRWLVGGSQTARLRLETTGVLTLADAGNAAEIATVSGIPTGQWVRVEWHIQFAVTTGVCDLRTYNNADSTTPTESLSSASLNALANCDTVQYGSFNSTTWTGWMDGLNVNTTGFPGPITGRPPAPVMSRAATVRAARW